MGWCVFMTLPLVEPRPQEARGIVQSAQHHVLAQSIALASESQGGIRTQPGSVHGSHSHGVGSRGF